VSCGFEVVSRLQANLRLSEMEGFRRGGILALPLLFVSSSGLSLPSIPPNLNDHPLSLKLALLRPKTAGGPFVEPSLADMTTALASISNAGLHPESWTTALENGSPWLTSFSAKPAALKAARGEGYAEAAAKDPKLLGRRFAKGMGVQSFAKSSESENEGTFVNSIALLFGVVRLSFSGGFSMTGRRMTLLFQTLQIRLLWFLKINMDIREGRGIRGLIERLRGGKKSAANEQQEGSAEAPAKFEKRPNVYAWCFSDDTIAIAQGTSGSVALWVSEAALAGECSK
jgi:hypothetical protein